MREDIPISQAGLVDVLISIKTAYRRLSPVNQSGRFPFPAWSAEYLVITMMGLDYGHCLDKILGTEQVISSQDCD